MLPLRSSAMPPGAMASAVQAMLGWGWDVLGLRAIRAPVFSDNQGIVRLLAKLGFAAVDSTPLRRHADGERVEYRPVEPGDTGPPDRTWLWLAIER